MENITELAVIALLSLLMARIILVPARAGLRLGIRAAGGFLCLWILNLSSGITGLALPLTAVTVFVAGYFGIPGIGLIACLEMI